MAGYPRCCLRMISRTSFDFRMSGVSKVGRALKDQQDLFLQQDVLMLVLQFMQRFQLEAPAYVAFQLVFLHTHNPLRSWKHALYQLGLCLILPHSIATANVLRLSTSLHDLI